MPPGTLEEAIVDASIAFCGAFVCQPVFGRLFGKMLHEVIEMSTEAVLLNSPLVRHGFLRITKCTELQETYVRRGDFAPN